MTITFIRSLSRSVMSRGTRETKQVLRSPAEPQPGSAANMPTSFNEIDALLERVRNTTLSMSHQYSGHSTTMAHQVNDLSATISVLYPTMVSLHRTCQEYEQRNASLEKLNSQLSSKLHLAEEDLSCHKKRVLDSEATIESLFTQKTKLEERVNSLQAENGRLQLLIVNLEAEHSSGKKRLAELESSAKVLETRLTRRETELLEYRSENAQLTNDLTELRLQIEARQKQLDQLREALSDHQASAAKNEALFVQAENDVQHVRSLLKRKEKEAEAARAHYESELERTRSELHEAKYSNEALQSRISTLERILKSQRSKLTNSSRHIAFLQSSLRSVLTRHSNQQQLDISFGLEDGEASEGAPAANDEENCAVSPGSGQPRMPRADEWQQGSEEGEVGRVIQIASGRKG